MNSKKNLYLYNYLPFIVISMVAILFGNWFARMQLGAISPNAFASYPLQFFLLTIFKCYLTILVLFNISKLILRYISAGNLDELLISISYIPLLAVYVYIPFYWIVCSIILLQVLFLYFHISKENAYRLISRYLTDGIILVVFFICHLILTSRFSPLHWHNSLLVAHGSNSEEIPVVTPIFRGYLLAKQFSFSFVDPAQWGGVMNPPITLSSPFMQLLAFVLDLPSVDYAAYHSLIMSIYFILAILGSFGFYLFLKYGAKLHTLFAFFGGYLFFFSGAPLLSLSFISDGGIFLSSQVVFPYALLMISLAFEKNNSIYAMGGGACLAAQFFFMAPHPEGTIYSLLFYGIFTGGLVLFAHQIKWSSRLYLAFITLITFLAFSAYNIVPILVDRLNHNMYVFAHTGDISPTQFAPFKLYAYLLLLFAPLSFLLLFVNKKISGVYLSSLLLAISIWALVYLTNDTNFTVRLTNILHIGLHFWVCSRIGVFFYMSTFIIAMFGLDILTSSILKLINNFNAVNSKISDERYDQIKKFT